LLAAAWRLLGMLFVDFHGSVRRLGEQLLEALKASRAVLRSIPDQMGKGVGRHVCTCMFLKCVFSACCSWHDDGSWLPLGVC
jgi:hypothetical protein